MNFSYELHELIDLLIPKKIIGHTSFPISHIGSLVETKQGGVSFLGNSKYRKEVEKSQASAILLPMELDLAPKENQCFLFFDNPSFALGKLCQDIERKCCPQPHGWHHPKAVIDATASIGQNVSIGPNVVVESNATIADNVIIMAGCYIGHSAKIGPNSVLHPSVVVMDFCEIGSRVTLFSGVIIGSDGFGYETVDGVHEKIPQIGNVVIGDDVDIGANTTIDRARFSHTKIGKGTKIDNLVQIGHNVTIGEGCLIIAQTGISGSTTIGNHVIIGGQVGIAGHINIPDGVWIGGKSSVVSYKSKMGKILRGNPAMSIGDANHFYVLRPKIPNLFDRVSKLEKSLSELLPRSELEQI
ncbi:MAG: UDP-3-O-(3-hydroxymyristoyl)glucosamine N-acyltransferase [Puniceicoccales bacterium]|jgi:UDP-3-O-[3-hydroxymyristoyl] glucosamine N-acyltransferase|nr:UDP-3-O-(3-hydroxymyristoyl)glucosamine N-acyltransferase [Puniceicoccales bacterium]